MRHGRKKGEFAFRDAPPRDDGGQLAGQFATLERAGIPSEAIKASYKEANFPAVLAKEFDPCTDLARTKDSIVATAAVLEMYAQTVRDYGSLAAEGKAAWPELALYDCAAW